MKQRFLLVVAIILHLNSYAQFGPQQIISTDVNAAVIVFASDIDGDGDMDVLSGSYNGNIYWHENIDGLGTFGPQILITDETSVLRDIFSVDLDGDGDMDVISASQADDKLAWYENTDGQGNFGPQQIISDELYSRPNSVYASDMDGDGDLDLVSAFESSYELVWFENMDGLGNFNEKQIIANLDDPFDVFVSDIDNDGDMDVFSASSHIDQIAWHENTNGLGLFGPTQVISTNAELARAVYAADLDGDGDVDVLSASEDDDKIAWYENTDGQGTFGSQQIITINADRAYDVMAIDVDGDGDLDVLSNSIADNKIAWYENMDGQGSFGPQQIISTEVDSPISIYASDLDGDGDKDVLSASWYDNKIAWYENLTILGNSEFDESLGFAMFPNPTSTKVTISSKYEVIQIDVYSQVGQLVLSKSESNLIDVSRLNSGIYFVKIRDEKENSSTQKLIVE